MGRWVQDKAIHWIWFNDLNGLMLMGMSQPLAIIPYYMRSIRISKMYELRDEYYDDANGNIPKEKISKYRERRLIKIMMIIICSYALITIGGTMLSYSSRHMIPFPTFNLLLEPLHNHG